MSKKEINIRDYVKLFFYGNGLMLKTSKSKYFALYILSVLGGVVSPVNAIFWEKLLNWFVEAFVNRKNIGNIGWYYLIMLSVLPFLGYIFDLLLDYIKQTFSDQMNLFITERVLTKAFKLSMERFDESSTYNDLQIATTRTTQNCMGLLDAITEMIFYTVQIISFILILANFNWKIIVLAIIGAVPSLYVALRVNKYWFDTLNNRIGKFRHIDYLKSLIVKNEYVKETKLYNMGNKILGHIKESFNKFISEDKKARKRILARRTFARVFDEILTLIIKVWILLESLKDKSAVGEVVLFFNANESLKGSLIVLLNELAKLHENVLYLQILKRVDDMEVEGDSHKEKVNSSFQRIEFRNVSFSYPGQNQIVFLLLLDLFEYFFHQLKYLPHLYLIFQLSYL